MNKNKESAQADWTDMIIKSWTWAKLTNDERNKFGDELNKEATTKNTCTITPKATRRETRRTSWLTARHEATGSMT